MIDAPTTSAQQEAFTEGDCWALALALHRRTGWQLVYVAEEDAFSPGELIWFHVAVETPKGEVLDVKGLYSQDKFLAAWRNTPQDRLVITTSTEYLGGCYPFFEQDVPGTAALLLNWYESLENGTPPSGS